VTFDIYDLVIHNAFSVCCPMFTLSYEADLFAYCMICHIDTIDCYGWATQPKFNLLKTVVIIRPKRFLAWAVL